MKTKDLPDLILENEDFNLTIRYNPLVGMWQGFWPEGRVIAGDTPDEVLKEIYSRVKKYGTLS